MAHLLELRDRLLRMILAVLAVFLVLFPFANDLYIAVSEPLRQALPEGSPVIGPEVLVGEVPRDQEQVGLLGPDGVEHDAVAATSRARSDREREVEEAQ